MQFILHTYLIAEINKGNILCRIITYLLLFRLAKFTIHFKAHQWYKFFQCCYPFMKLFVFKVIAN